MLSCVQLFVTPWTAAYQAPLSMGFPRQEYWSGLQFPPPGDLPDLGIKPTSLFVCPWRFSRQGYWSGLPCPLPGDLPDPGIEPRSPALQEDSLPSEQPGKPRADQSVTRSGTLSQGPALVTSQSPQEEAGLLQGQWRLTGLQPQNSESDRLPPIHAWNPRVFADDARGWQRPFVLNFLVRPASS